jgi:type III pantothenate kinase
MLLLIDAGNTRIKWALAHANARPGQWVDSGAATHAELDTLPARWMVHAPVTRAIVANVAGAVIRTRLAGLLFNVKVNWFASLPELGGMKNHYRNPYQLGCDRFAAAYGARALAPGQRLVVATCGTATTIDAIDDDGNFAGGMILPGLGLMASSLARNTAALPQVVPGALPPLFADNTDDAIVSGCLSAQAGAIARAVERHQASTCILSGGAAAMIAPALSIDYRIVDNIVLTGLHAAAATLE